MKLRSTAIIIIVVALLWIAASGCSSLGVALDTSYVGETYSVESRSDEYQEKSNGNVNIFPKLVSSNNVAPLFNVSLTNDLSLGIDYEIFYYGYDTLNLISDVINNKKSLSDSIEYPSKEIGGDRTFNLFSFSPMLLGVLSGKPGFFLASGFGFPQYSSFSVDREKYEIKEESIDGFIYIGYNFYFKNTPLSLISRQSNKEFKAQKPGATETDTFTFEFYSLILRSYF